MPRFSDDDYIDYCVLEASMIKHNQDEAAAGERERKKAERQQWQKGEPGSGGFPGGH